MKLSSIRLLIFVLAGSAVLLTAKVITDFNHGTDFSRYRTYSWLKVEAGDPLWPDRIMTAVDTQLTEKGWSKVPADGDASVAAFGSSHTQPRLETFYDNFGGGWFWRGFGDGMAITNVENIAIGTLVVDIFDTPTKKLIWRGIVNDVLSDKPEKNEKKLEKGVEEMFKHFPPNSEG